VYLLKAVKLFDATLQLTIDINYSKSTIIALLERYYDATEGSILINGVDIKDLNVEWLRAQIGKWRILSIDLK